ncbi:uncharacterized protein LOC110652065 isoform X1 [Hevea brasiliensis]|uniref:uncharacterized protein LOC110652065 isoform X1 n=1 Tax=Hevea brasiliensis TaxID=3981 RepID=UPI000B77517B|nr:uncharacterized protein LOC110652065 isoform X1 [Hevea brasiliensis]
MHQLRGAETASSNFYASSNPTTTAWSTSIPSCCQSATGISTKSSADATTATPGSPSANAPFAYATSKYAAATTTITFTPPPSSSSTSSSTNASSWCAWILACAFIDAHITPIANARSNGTMNQMVPPMPQGHFMGMNPMHSGSLTTSAAPSVGGFPNGLPNMQGPSNATGAQMYPQGGSFNRPPGVQMPMMPGLIPTSLGINLVCLHHYHHVLRLIPNHLSRSLFHHRAAAAAYMWMETTTCTGLLALVLTHVHFNSLGYSFCLFSAFIV